VQCSPEEFVERWSQHIPERYRHAVRSFGLFAPRATQRTFDAVFAILGQERRSRPKPRGWAESIKRDFKRDPLLDSKGKRMTWVRRIAPKVPCKGEASQSTFAISQQNCSLPRPAVPLDLQYCSYIVARAETYFCPFSDLFMDLFIKNPALIQSPVATDAKL
jgi:hypothetical protein